MPQSPFACMRVRDLRRTSTYRDVSEMCDEAIMLRLGIEVALDQQREAPWYLPWGISLKNTFNSVQRGHCITTTTMISAQYPITAEYEIEHEEDDGSDDEVDDANDNEDEESDEDRLMARRTGLYHEDNATHVLRRGEASSPSSESPDELDCLPARPSHSHQQLLVHDSKQRRAVSSPGVGDHSLQGIDPPAGSEPSVTSASRYQTPSSLSTHHANSTLGSVDYFRHLNAFSPLRDRVFQSMTPEPPAPPADHTSATPLAVPTSLAFSLFDFNRLLVKSLQAAARLKSTRSPDFSRVVCALSHQKIEQLDLIVEIKRNFGSQAHRKWAALDVQVDEQAVHAFTQDSDLLVIGCIKAIGPWWTYREIWRSEVNLDFSLDGSWRGSTPRSSTPPLPINPSHTYEKLDKTFRQQPPLNLADPKSTTILQLISKRLQELNPRLWATDDESEDEGRGDDDVRPSQGCVQPENEGEGGSDDDGDDEGEKEQEDDIDDDDDEEKEQSEEESEEDTDDEGDASFIPGSDEESEE